MLSNALEKHPESVDEELINILAELCIMTKTYQQVYDVGRSVIMSTLHYSLHPPPPPPLSLFLSLSPLLSLSLSCSLLLHLHVGHHQFLQHVSFHPSSHLP